jgi:hypothetical protein
LGGDSHRGAFLVASIRGYKSRGDDDWIPRDPLMAYPPRILFINSERDEAYGFLVGVRNASAPWREGPDPQRNKYSFEVPSWLQALSGKPGARTPSAIPGAAEGNSAFG